MAPTLLRKLCLPPCNGRWSTRTCSNGSSIHVRSHRQVGHRPSPRRAAGRTSRCRENCPCSRVLWSCWCTSAGALSGGLILAVRGHDREEPQGCVQAGAQRSSRLVTPKAAANRPCVVFFDELDAIAASRSGGTTSSRDVVRERAVATLLAEMDGVGGQAGKARVVVVAATNRADAIDSALLRPGRLSAIVQVRCFVYYGMRPSLPLQVELPNSRVRRSILSHSCAGLRLSTNLDWGAVAEQVRIPAQFRSPCRPKECPVLSLFVLDPRRR